MQSLFNLKFDLGRIAERSAIGRPLLQGAKLVCVPAAGEGHRILACAVGRRIVLRALDAGLGTAALGDARRSPIRIKTPAFWRPCGRGPVPARSVPPTTVGAGPCSKVSRWESGLVLVLSWRKWAVPRVCAARCLKRDRITQDKTRRLWLSNCGLALETDRHGERLLALERP